MHDDGSAHHGKHQLDDLPPELAQRVQAELAEGENLLWAGQPRPDLFARGSIFLAIFGIFFTVFAVVWMLVPLGMGILVGAAGATASDEPAGSMCGVPFCCFSLFGIPFILVGGWLLTSPIWQRRLAKMTCYVVTTQRAIAWEAGFFGRMTVRNYRPAALQNMVREENADGSGSLIFQETLETSGRRVWTRRHGFIGISDVGRVENLIQTHLLKTGN